MVKMNYSAFLVDVGLLCSKDPIKDVTVSHNKMDILYCIILYYTVLFYDITILHHDHTIQSNTPTKT
jgi:hypothetical protein